MRKVGTKSWRFAHDIDQSLHCALYLRDALRFLIEDQAGVPPRLAGDLPDRSHVLGPEPARTATARWPSWWHTLVTQLAPAQLGTPGGTDTRSWLREISARRRTVVDPPDWNSLEDSPALREALCAVWVDSSRWFEATREPYLPPACQDMFAWEQVRDGAERAAAEHAVSLGQVNGCVEVLLVEGLWWHLIAPGVALCSVAAAQDPGTARTILRETFGSHLAR